MKQCDQPNSQQSYGLTPLSFPWFTLPAMREWDRSITAMGVSETARCHGDVDKLQQGMMRRDLVAWKIRGGN